MKITNIEDWFFSSYNCFLIMSLHVSYWIFLESCYSKKEKKIQKVKLNGCFPRLFRPCRQINKKLLIVVTTSNLSSLYELKSKELHENDKKLEALRHQPPRWSHQTSLNPAVFISLYKYWLSLKIGKMFISLWEEHTSFHCLFIFDFLSHIVQGI